jgi:hypothetical protein
MLHLLPQTRGHPGDHTEPQRTSSNARSTAMLDKVTTLSGYTLQSLDGTLGTVKEFYFDDQHWAIRYLVADTGTWLTGRHVLVSPYALRAVNREEHSIVIALTKQQIEDSPSLSSDKPVSRQFEEAYYEYYYRER